MKRTLTTLLLGGMALSAMAQLPVRDRALMNQLERRAYFWNQGWRPYYFFTDYYSLFHRSYKKGGDKTIKVPYTPAIASYGALMVPGLKAVKGDLGKRSTQAIRDDLSRLGPADLTARALFKKPLEERIAKLKKAVAHYLGRPGASGLVKAGMEMLALWENDKHILFSVTADKGKREQVLLETEKLWDGQYRSYLKYCRLFETFDRL